MSLTYLDDVPHDSIIGNSFNKLNLRARLEVVDLVFDLPYYNNVFGLILSLNININVIRYFPQSILYKKHLVFQNYFF